MKFNSCVSVNEGSLSVLQAGFEIVIVMIWTKKTSEYDLLYCDLHNLSIKILGGPHPQWKRKHFCEEINTQERRKEQVYTVPN